jgi:hypothetical protein
MRSLFHLEPQILASFPYFLSGPIQIEKFTSSLRLGFDRRRAILARTGFFSGIIKNCYCYPLCYNSRVIQFPRKEAFGVKQTEEPTSRFCNRLKKLSCCIVVSFIPAGFLYEPVQKVYLEFSQSIHRGFEFSFGQFERAPGIYIPPATMKDSF